MKHAFPQVEITARRSAEGGMSLRDYFAAKALQGWLSTFIDDRNIEPDMPALATFCYRVADAMLAEREKPGCTTT